MQLSRLLEVTGTKRGHFTALRRTGNLPFYVPQNERAAGWRQFSMADAFALRLMLEMVGTFSKEVGAEVLTGFARSAVMNALGKVPSGLDPQAYPGADPEAFAAAPLDLYLGFLEFEEEPRDGESYRRTVWFNGELSMLSKKVEKEEGTAAEWGCTSIRLRRAILVNASEAARTVLKREASAGET